MTKTYKINPLYPGQVVGIWNDSRLATVIGPVGKQENFTVYKLLHAGREIEISRERILVCIQGRYFGGPRNEVK